MADVLVVGRINREERVRQHLTAATNLPQNAFSFCADLSVTQKDWTATGNLFLLAQPIAEQMVDELATHFRLLETDLYQPGKLAFLFSLQFRLAREDLVDFFDALGKRKSNQAMLLWNSLLPNSFYRLHSTNQQKIETFSTDTQSFIQQSLNLALDRLNSIGVSLEPKIPPSSSQPIAVCVIGSHVDVQLGTKYFQHWGFHGPCVILLKNDQQQLADAFVKANPQIEMVAKHTIAELEPTLEDARDIFNFYKKFLKKAASDTPLINTLAPALPDLIDSLWVSRALTNYFGNLQPSVIFGTFEKSPLGVMLSNGCAPDSTKVVSYQHGIMGKTATMQRMSFDRLYIWNQKTRQTILADGYPATDGIVVANLKPNQTLNPARQPMRWQRPSWVPKGACAVYFDQPIAKGPYTAADHRDRLLAIAELGSKYNFTLLVKPHPKSYDEAVTKSISHPKLHWLDPQVSLEGSISAADFAISINSTALVEFQESGKPTIAWDEKSWGTMVGLPEGLFEREVRSFEELEQAIARLRSFYGKYRRVRNMLSRRWKYYTLRSR